jgi:hypothetical protein
MNENELPPVHHKPRRRKIPVEHAVKAESFIRAILVWAAALAFVACILSGSGVKPCAGAACSTMRSIIPTEASAHASVPRGIPECEIFTLGKDRDECYARNTSATANVLNFDAGGEEWCRIDRDGKVTGKYPHLCIRAEMP